MVTILSQKVKIFKGFLKIDGKLYPPHQGTADFVPILPVTGMVTELFLTEILACAMIRKRLLVKEAILWPG